ncbi:histidine phosphatase family protein [Candidatus Pelagibacter sp.]|nr:histidine phosphatase family protein [Candidatus Pelagibacter sp.]
MKFLKFILILFISLTTLVKADSKKNIIENLKVGGKLIFIRHAYAPGGGDPENFNIYDCSTQRNLSESGRIQSRKIGNFFKENKIKIENVYSSEWCRCKETASLAFENFNTKSFLNSFFSSKFAQNKNSQMKDFQKFLLDWDEKTNLIFVTHYVVISEILDYPSSSGEIVISNKNFKIIDTLEIEY